jgi:dihydrodipicolinate synthase/N-acetylneuraminate lyase
MFNERASGVYVIAATPFHDDGRIDHDSVERLTDFYIGCGVKRPSSTPGSRVGLCGVW